MSVLTVWRPSFDLRPRVAHLPEGLTLAQMVGAMPGLPHDFAARGVICINGRPVQRAAWGMLRPKATGPGGVPVEVTLHLAPMGGGGDGRRGGKQVFALVASIALTAVTAGIAGGGAFKLLGASFVRGTIGATALAAGVSLAGSLLISALTAPPVAAGPQRQRPTEGAASATGNVLEPNGAIPRVFGERKVFPPLAAEPLTYFDGPDEVVEAVYALAGPHRLTDLRAGAVPVADLPGVEVETRAGWPGDPPLSIVRRQARTEQLQAEITGHSTDETDGARLDIFTDIAQALPQPQVVATRDGPDEHWLHLVLPQGLHDQASDSTRLRIPLRLRMRPRGAAEWTNLPELHVQAASIRQMRLTLRLVWSAQVPAPSAANAEGFVEARRSAPDQTSAPAGGGFAAHPSFGAGGDAWMDANNLGATGVTRVEMSRFEAAVYLDPAVFPPGRWEIEIRRGATIRTGDWSASAYTVSGSVWDLFGYRDPAAPRIARSRDGLSDMLVLLRSVSIRNRRAVAPGEMALIGITARNRALEAVSCTAGGWVPDWDGTAWRAYAVTDNPAPHLRDVLAGALNARPVPVDLIDDADLLAWRADCTAQGLRVNHLSEDESVLDAARIIASCGYARPRMSDQWGVVRDRDRSAEVPVQLFTPRNSRGLSWTRALPDLPDGFRVSFSDASRDYDRHQIDVPRRGRSVPLRLPEQVSYDGLVNEAEVRARAEFDLMQAELRGTFWTLDAPVEAIVARTGDLVGVAHDMLTEWMGAARIVERRFDGAGDVVALVIDGAVPVISEPRVQALAGVQAVTSVQSLGQTSGVIVRGPAGPGPALALTNATGSTATLDLAVPQDPADMPEGALVTVGLTGSELLRLVVMDVTPRENLTASLTLVDEAPALFATRRVVLNGSGVVFDGAPLVFTAA